MNINAVLLNEKDNVAVLLEDVCENDTVRTESGGELAAVSDIGFSHKILLEDLRRGEDIIKYGEVIGRANADLKKGEWIHIHNMIDDTEGT
jgi:altronate dehydratase small subunit